MGLFLFKKVKIKTLGYGYYFYLYSENHLILATSQVYSSLAACKKGAKSVVCDSAVAALEDLSDPLRRPHKCPRFELYTDGDGYRRVRLRDRNGESVLASQRYSTEDAVRLGVQAVITQVQEPRFFTRQGSELVELLGVERQDDEPPAVTDVADTVLFTERPLGELASIDVGDESDGDGEIFFD